MKINYLTVAKFVVSGIVGIGTGKIVGKAIKNTIQPETLIEKITVSAAAWVIGGIATEATKKYTNNMIDDLTKAVTAVVDHAKLTNKVTRVNAGLSTFEEEGLDPSRFQKNENNMWVFSSGSLEYFEDGKQIDPDTVCNLIETHEWTYDFENDIWPKKDKSGKAFKQIKLPGGGAKWVWVKIA